MLVLVLENKTVHTTYAILPILFYMPWFVRTFNFGRLKENYQKPIFPEFSKSNKKVLKASSNPFDCLFCFFLVVSRLVFDSAGVWTHDQRLITYIVVSRPPSPPKEFSQISWFFGFKESSTNDVTQFWTISIPLSPIFTALLLSSQNHRPPPPKTVTSFIVDL